MGAINMKKLAFILILISIAGCSHKTDTQEVTSPSLKAVYFIQNKAQLSSEDLDAHPEVVVARTFNDFKQYG